MPEQLQHDEPIDPRARPGVGEEPGPRPMVAQNGDVGPEPDGDPLEDVRGDRPSPLSEEQQQAADRDAFLSRMRDQFRESADATAPLRSRIVADRQFAAGGAAQWMLNGKNLQQERWAEGRPAHTVNRIPGFVKQVTNGIREARLAIEYIPVDDTSDPDRAEVFQGLARHVEQNSDSPADIAYETAMEHQVEAGLGWFYARTYYVHDQTDEQDILIERVRNPLTVYWDPTCQRFDFSDARYLFRIEEMPLSTYQRLYGATAPIASLESFATIGDRSNWIIRDKVRVAEYFYIEHTKKRLVLLLPEGSGSPEFAGPIAVDAIQKKFLEDLKPEELPRVALMGGQPVVLREVEVPRVMWAKVNGIGVIDGNKERTGGRPVPGKYIPYAPVIGDERDLDGDVDYRGMVRDLKDAQMMVNFWQSAITEAIALAPRSPFVISAGQIKDFQQVWNEANNKSFAYLPYNAEDIGGHLVPPPQRSSIEPAIQAMVVALQIAENHLRALAGFYDVEPRDKKTEQSGKAILARQQQGERGNSNFHGNLARAIRHMGRVLLYMFPEVYDTARVKRITGADENEQTVQVYSGEQNKPAQPKMDQKSKQPLKVYDLSDPRYDVRTSVGPSYPTRRQEGFDKLMELSKVNPLVGQVGADIIIGMLDAPGSRELAKRVKKLPQIAALIDDDGQDPEVKVAQLEAQTEKMGQLIDMLTKELNGKSAVIETEQAKYAAMERIKLLEIASKEAIEIQKQQIELLKMQVQAESATQMTTLKAQLERMGTTMQAAFEHSHQEHMARIQGTQQQEQMAMQAALQASSQEDGGQPAGGPGGPEGMAPPAEQGDLGLA